MKSGFGSFQNLSSISSGKKTAVDSYSTLDIAIKTILGDINAAIFTTAIPSSIIVDNNGLVSQWNPLNYTSSNLFFSQSINTSKPILSSVDGLGKYSGIYCVSDDNLRTVDAINLFKKVTTVITYHKWVSFQTTPTVGYLFRLFNTSYGASSQFPGVFYNKSSGLSQTRYTNTFGGTTKNAFLAFNDTSGNIKGTTIFGSNTNTFRVFEQIYNSNNRSVTSSYYDQNKDVINLTADSSGLIDSSNKYSFTFTSASVTASAVNWDAQFPSNSFMPYTASIGSNTGDQKISYHVYIQCCTDSPIGVDAIKNLKNLLDKVYGA